MITCIFIKHFFFSNAKVQDVQFLSYLVIKQEVGSLNPWLAHHSCNYREKSLKDTQAVHVRCQISFISFLHPWIKRHETSDIQNLLLLCMKWQFVNAKYMILSDVSDGKHTIIYTLDMFPHGPWCACLSPTSQPSSITERVSNIF